MTSQFSRSVRVAVAALLLLAAVAGPVAAQSDESSAEVSTYDAFVEMSDLYNERAASLDLGVAERLLAGARVNAYVTDGDEETAFSFTLDDQMRIVDVQPEPDEDATVRIETDRATVQRIIDSENPAAAFRSAVTSGDIRIDGERGHFVSQAVWTVANGLKGLLF
jgi:hypothetical protein